MQQQELIRYMEQPHTLDAASVPALRQLVADFPYFQPAHILLSMASRKWDATVYQQSLPRTALTVASRAHLFDLIHALDTRKAEEPAPVQPAAAAETQPAAAPDSQNELDILKATEIAASASVETVAPQPPPVAVPAPIIVETSEMPPAEETVDREIARQVVTSFIEKEVLDTPSLHKPAPPPREQPGSFGDWLAYLKKNNGQPYSEIEEQVNLEKAKQKSQAAAPEPAEDAADTGREARKAKNKAIIDRIIDKNPGLIRTREEQKFYAPEVKARESLLENEHLMTETLARIYALQGNISKAVRAYEILSLKYPQKSAYFATLIQQLKNNNNP